MFGVGIKLSKPQEVVKTEAFTHSVTVQRSNFPSGNLACNVDDEWTATGTDGVEYKGIIDIYTSETTGSTHMHSRPRTPFFNHLHNTKPFPGRINKIVVPYHGGVARDVAPLYESSHFP